MRITHCIERLRFEDGGPVRAVIDLAEALAARGHRLTVLTHDDADAPEAWSVDDALPSTRVLPSPAIGPLMSGSQRAAARALLAESDVVHAHGIWVPTTAQLAAEARRAGTPYVVSIRGMLDDWCMAQSALKKKLYLRLLGSGLLNNAGCVHLTAQAELDQARKHFDAPAEVIPNLMNLGPFDPLPGKAAARERFGDELDSDVPTLLFLSRIHYKKGIESLLDASAALTRRGVSHQAIIAGTGDEAYVRTLHERKDAAGATEAHFIGHITGEAKISLYQLADLFVLPTSQENFGFVYFEALAAGTAVLTTKGTDTWAELESSGGGFILPDAEPAALADRIEALLADRESLRQSGEAGRSWVFDQMHPDRLVERFEAMYQKLT